MSSSRSNLPLLLASLGAAVIVPVMLGSVWTTWRASVESRNPTQEKVDEALRLQRERELVAHEPAPEPPPPPEPSWGRDMDRVLLEKFTEFGMVEDRLDDVMPDQTFRVDVKKGDNRFLLDVDIDRDGKIDEAWDVHGSEATRGSQPDGHGGYAVHDHWDGHRWSPVGDP